ncbi:hypothetical protein GCM10007907_16740 [Chitinimonas prasina]|uniref:Uncharacterized protein n=1 Tax=Chitinimonas prasina TaxID=1434937 RepID=A0ABQ5YIU6_9NEIS|nr:hypothetical protein [Chitinimonas prasina]GLR12884.1 hypothetical protein GCM10007907_16740 [Chitinimonas prasina]
MASRLVFTTLIATLGFTVAQAGDHGYKHSHAGSEQARTNGDVTFGQPADAHHAERKLALELTSAGKLNGKAAGVEENEVLGFDLKNSSKQPIAFVVGDKAAIEEFASLYRNNADSASKDFHAVQIAAGQSQKFGWKFSTFRTSTVSAAFVGMDGTIQDHMLTFSVHTNRNRN